MPPLVLATPQAKDDDVRNGADVPSVLELVECFEDIEGLRFLCKTVHHVMWLKSSTKRRENREPHIDVVSIGLQMSECTNSSGSVALKVASSRNLVVCCLPSMQAWQTSETAISGSPYTF